MPTDIPTERSYLLPLLERISRLLLRLLGLLSADTLRFPERRRLDRILSRLTAAFEQYQIAGEEVR
jgi:hypothetical protein